MGKPPSFRAFICLIIFSVLSPTSWMSDLSKQRKDILGSQFAISATPFNKTFFTLPLTISSENASYEPSNKHLHEPLHFLNSSWSNLSKPYSTRDNLPRWLKDYIIFHRQSLQNINASNWRNARFLIIRCYHMDKCGGTSDRLKPIPLFLLYAARYNRVLFIRWTRPYPLEAFLLPVTMNWTVPNWLVPTLIEDSNFSAAGDSDQLFIKVGRSIGQEELERALGSSLIIVEAKMQATDGSASLYRNLLNSMEINAFTSGYGPEYHSIFRALFQPSPPVANIINSFFQATGLIPGKYVVAHQRALYDVKNMVDAVPRDKVVSQAIHAIHCASQLHPNVPIFFASDSAVGIQAIRTLSASYPRPIVTREADGMPPLHLELDSRNASRQRLPSAFYATFVDLWIMGSGSCVAYGKGGFGQWGLWIGYNFSCGFNYIGKRCPAVS